LGQEKSREIVENDNAGAVRIAPLPGNLVPKCKLSKKSDCVFRVLKIWFHDSGNIAGFSNERVPKLLRDAKKL
jgi:hypothetical protein